GKDGRHSRPRGPRPGVAPRRLPALGAGRSGGAAGRADRGAAGPAFCDALFPPEPAPAGRPRHLPARGALADLRGRLRRHERPPGLPDRELLPGRARGLRRRRLRHLHPRFRRKRERPPM
ncbi:MAG: Arsenical resistance operon repressor, partial [uncultured Acetobacteraceae bacterium]